MERIYLEEEPEGFWIERHGRSSAEKPRKQPNEVEEDLLAEVPRLMKELGLVCRVRMRKYRSYKERRGRQICA